MDGDAETQDIYRKIERKKAIIHTSNQMRRATNNALINLQVESRIQDAIRNIRYFKQSLQELQTRKMGGDMYIFSTYSNKSLAPPLHSRWSSSGTGGDNEQSYGGGEDYGNPGPGGYSLGGAPEVMLLRALHTAPGPGDRSPRSRPNYSKLGEYNNRRCKEI